MPRFSPTVIDHFSTPRNCGRVPGADVSALVGNPVCGDQILLSARTDGARVAQIGFEAFGCSAALAVASILTEHLAGMTVDELDAVDADLILLWSGGLGPEQRHTAVLGADVCRRLAVNARSGANDDGRYCGE